MPSWSRCSTAAPPWRPRSWTGSTTRGLCCSSGSASLRGRLPPRVDEERPVSGTAHPRCRKPASPHQRGNHGQFPDIELAATRGSEREHADAAVVFVAELVGVRADEEAVGGYHEGPYADAAGAGRVPGEGAAGGGADRADARAGDRARAGALGVRAVRVVEEAL